MPIEFIKFHGYGNDYIVIAAAQLAGVPSLGGFARQICTRHYGAGADGIAVVSRSENDEADFLVRIFNPDGSEAGLSGNGTRCAASWLYYQGLWAGDELRLNTRTGVKKYFLRAEPGPGKYVFASELGRPKLDSASVPLITDAPLGQVIDYPLPVDGDIFKITAMQMGNPNCSIFVDDFEELDWRTIGRAIETHPQFPDRTNVTFVRVVNREQIELRIWERGVGETTASGTCSCAAAVASMINDKTDRRVTALTPGGQVEIHWRDDNEVVITGSAEVVYSGQWLANAP
jgi:diaminopimelate epimerase